MGLTDAQIEHLTDKYIVSLYQQMEKDVITDIARRVRKTGRFTETAELMAKDMAEQGFSTEKIYAEVMKQLRADPDYQKQIAENTKQYKKMVEDEIKSTVKAAEASGDKLVAEAGTMAWNSDLSMWQQAGQDLGRPNQLDQIVQAFKSQTVGELKNLTKTTGFVGTSLGTTGVKQAYQRTVDTALLKVATGTFSFDEACNEAVRDLAHSGLKTIDYASGRSYQLDTAARMSVRTSLNKLAGSITEANIKSTGVEYIRTSSHAGARPDHAAWQGQVWTLEELETVCGYGKATGICGVNCRHKFFPYWPGISVPVYQEQEPAPVAVGDKVYNYYDATQKQRQMERDIRALKRESYSAGSEEEQKKIDRKIRAKSAEYHKFSSAVGIKAKDNRLRVVA